MLVSKMVPLIRTIEIICSLAINMNKGITIFKNDAFLQNTD